jgi:methylmalonyl-CoA mutase, C-terminal domain
MFRPRIIVGLLGIDQHEVGAVAVAALLRDAGMEVIYAGRYNTPALLVRMAADEDADVIGISCHSWEYLHYLPTLMRSVRQEELDVAVVLGGSVITESDARQMRGIGVADIFGPASSSEQIVGNIRALAAARQQRVQAGLKPTHPKEAQ